MNFTNWIVELKFTLRSDAMHLYSIDMLEKTQEIRENDFLVKLFLLSSSFIDKNLNVGP